MDRKINEIGPDSTGTEVKSDEYFMEVAIEEGKKVSQDSTGTKAKSDEFFMEVAIEEAKKAEKVGDVPVGAVVVRDGKIISRAHNQREKSSDATAHAEMLAIRKASKKLGRWNLSDCELFITLEPCAMCAGAVVNSRIRRVIFGAYDKRFGCGGSLHNLLKGSGLNHEAEISAGILEADCTNLMSSFFKALRKK